MKYQTIRITSDKDVRVMFRTYWRYMEHNSANELYVDFEEVVVAQVRPSSYMANQYYDEIVHSSYPVSHYTFCKYFLFQTQLIM